MTVRLLLDEMYPPSLAAALREHGHDVVAVAASAEPTGCDDATVLDAAATAKRCLVTENIRDFAVLIGHTNHYGVLFVHARRWPRTRTGLRKLADALHDVIPEAPGPNEVRWL